VKILESGIRFFFSKKNIIAPKRAKMHFTLKEHFFNRNCNKKKQKITKISEILLNCFLAKTKKQHKKSFFPFGACGGGLVFV